MAFGPTKQWKSLCTIHLVIYLNLRLPTDFADEAFFIGLILGHFMGAGISFVIDMVWFPGQGHGIPFSD
jgi:hypothetical protein